ncbi:MAG: hypothetical protein CSYNP_02808 [Syntrophus sp. SKADARSKE-3]|nr:hypothetical protein [Syntrophus sp. SKADARSKE-3]
MMNAARGRYYDLPWPIVDEDGTVHHEHLQRPLRRRKPTVYAITNDFGHPAISHQFMWDVIRVAAQCPQHTILALTKRPQQYVDFCKWVMDTAEIKQGEYGTFTSTYEFPDNWWSCLTIHNQLDADSMIPIFKDVPGNKLLNISMAGSVDIEKYLWLVSPSTNGSWKDYSGKIIYSGEGFGGQMVSYRPSGYINAVILGGGTCPLHPDWIRSIRDQCQRAGLQFFFQGWGKYFNPLSEDKDSPDGQVCRVCGCTWNNPCAEGCAWIEEDLCSACERKPVNKKYSPGGFFRIGDKKSGRLLDGQTHDALPWRIDNGQ